MNKLILAFALLAVYSVSAATDYCGQPGICSEGKTHVTCGASGGMSSSCPSDAKFIDLSTLQKEIIDSHNEKRNRVAGGKIPKHSPAVRMATIQWDDELAYMAGLNVKTCNYGHDECRNTNAFKFSGQNLAKNWWYGQDSGIKELVLGQIDGWFSENKDSDMSKINNVGSTGGPTTGHFTVMVAELSTRVGCAAVRSSEWDAEKQITWQTLTTACNYSHTNVKGHRIYTSGKATSKCTTGVNPKYQFLCSTKEKYDPNTPIPA
ncbi:Ag5r.2 family protein [Megaselia abdita]